MVILDGKILSERIFGELQGRVAGLAKSPRLAAVLIGKDAGSVLFLKRKEEACKRIGAEFRLYAYKAEISAQELSAHLNQIVREGNADGIIIQLPLPQPLDANRHALLRIIPEHLDVDALSERASGRLMSGRLTLQFKHGRAELLSPFAKTLLRFFQEYDIVVKGKYAVVVGWGELIGKAAVPVLLRAGATVTVCTTKTPDISLYTREADIIISGAGQPRLISGDMVKDGVIVIDAAWTMHEGAQRGDMDFESVSQKASFITPVPGGVGPMVVAMLLENLVAFSEARQNKG